MAKYNGFKSWSDYMNNSPCDPIANYIEYGVAFGLDYELHKLRLPKESIIKQFQRILGKQKFTWFNGEERSYIWEYDIYRLYIARNKGRVIELFYPGSKEFAITALNHHINLMEIGMSLEELDIKNYKYSE